MENLDPQPRRRPAYVAGRVAIRVLGRGVRGAAGLGQLAYHNKVGAMAVVGLMAALLWLGGTGMVPLSHANQADVMAQPAAATETFWRAWRDGSAQEMWDSLSEELQGQFTAGGGGLSGLQQQLDQARAAGVLYSEATLVGSYPLTSGQTVYFYVASRQGPDGTDQVPFTFTVDEGGKIQKIE